MLTQEYLKEILYYNGVTGIFTWKTNKSNSIKLGQIAGSITGYGYREIMLDNKAYPAANLAVLYMEGYYPIKVDHIDTNRTNNSYLNLRTATKEENNWNRSIASNNTTGIKGLSLNRQGRWSCTVTAYGNRIIKYFKLHEKEQAINWLKTTRTNLHKEFTNHG